MYPPLVTLFFSHLRWGFESGWLWKGKTLGQTRCVAVLRDQDLEDEQQKLWLEWDGNLNNQNVDAQKKNWEVYKQRGNSENQEQHFWMDAMRICISGSSRVHDDQAKSNIHACVSFFLFWGWIANGCTLRKWCKCSKTRAWWWAWQAPIVPEGQIQF